MNTQVDLTEKKETVKNDYYLQKGHFESDEIDLAQLFSIIWKGKKIILGTTLVFTLLSSFYAFTVQEWWTSSAVITQAKSTQLLPIYKQVKQLEAAFNDNGINNKVSSNELKNYLSSDFFLKQFLQKFNSIDNKTEFLSKNAIFKKEISSFFDFQDQDKADLERLFRSWDVHIKAEVVKGSGFYNLTFSALMPEASKLLLIEYINFTNNKVLNETYSDMSALINSRKLVLQQKIEIIYSGLKNQLKQEVEQVKIAFEIAKAANISKPIENISNNNQHLEMLGSDILAQKILKLEQLTNLSVLEDEPKLNNFYIQLDLLQQIKLSIRDAVSYYFIEKPAEPLTRDRPKRSLIIILGFLLGAMFGSAFVLFKNAFITDKKNS